jgi:hypothetical protein
VQQPQQVYTWGAHHVQPTTNYTLINDLSHLNDCKGN